MSFCLGVVSARTGWVTLLSSVNCSGVAGISVYRPASSPARTWGVWLPLGSRIGEPAALKIKVKPTVGQFTVRGVGRALQMSVRAGPYDALLEAIPSTRTSTRAT